MFPEASFPVDGVIYSENNRLMVCLPCRRVKKPAATINVWFIVDTGSNCSFLSKETIEALIRKDDPFPKALRIAVQVTFYLNTSTLLLMFLFLGSGERD